MASTFCCSCAVDRLDGGVGGGVAGVALGEHDVLAVEAAGLVDLGDGHLDAGDLGWSEEREVAGLRAAACRSSARRHRRASPSTGSTGHVGELVAGVDRS